jgi:hypothetical protein
METVMNAQFTETEVAEAVRGLGATVLKPRKAPRVVARVKQSKGFVKGSNGFAVGFPVKTFV